VWVFYFISLLLLPGKRYDQIRLWGRLVTLRISYDGIKPVKGNISLIWNPSRNWRNYSKNQYIITLKFWFKKEIYPNSARVRWAEFWAVIF
jgi:hypothetical protein